MSSECQECVVDPFHKGVDHRGFHQSQKRVAMKETPKVINPIYELTEGFDLIEASFKEGVGFVRWSAISYLKRAGLKVEGYKTLHQSLVSDLQKAKHYIERWLEYEESKVGKVARDFSNGDVEYGMYSTKSVSGK